MAEHALLSASSSKQWLNCPPSAKLCSVAKGDKSAYADKGSFAHSLAEVRLKFRLLGKKDWDIAKTGCEKHEYYSPSIEEAVRDYVNYCYSWVEYAESLGEKYSTYVEKRVDYSLYVPDGFGTCDFGLIAESFAVACDYKNGAGVEVSAEDNTQMMLYLLGLLEETDTKPESLHVAIIQPFIKSEPEEWQLSLNYLMEWADSIRPIAARAYMGKGEFRAGEHCRFCKIRGKCRTRAEYMLEIVALQNHPNLLTLEQLGELLTKGADLSKWYDDLYAKAQSEALAGEEIPELITLNSEPSTLAELKIRPKEEVPVAKK